MDTGTLSTSLTPKQLIEEWRDALTGYKKAYKKFGKLKVEERVEKFGDLMVLLAHSEAAVKKLTSQLVQYTEVMAQSLIESIQKDPQNIGVYLHKVSELSQLASDVNRDARIQQQLSANIRTVAQTMQRRLIGYENQAKQLAGNVVSFQQKHAERLQQQQEAQAQTVVNQKNNVIDMQEKRQQAIEQKEQAKIQKQLQKHLKQQQRAA